MEETYEEVRLALGAASSGAGLPAPTPLLSKHACRQHQSAPSGGPPRCTLPCEAFPAGVRRPQAGRGQGEEGLTAPLGLGLGPPTLPHVL